MLYLYVIEYQKIINKITLKISKIINTKAYKFGKFNLRLIRFIIFLKQNKTINLICIIYIKNFINFIKNF